MPTYQYACTACGHQLEAVQSFADEPLTVCPACEGRLRKVFSSVGVVFKGSGFYRTDSRNGSGAGKEKAAESKPTESTSTEGKSTDSKPAGETKPTGDRKPAAAASTAASGAQ